GIDLIPGVKVSDSSMLYGRVGWVRGKFRTSIDPFIVSAPANDQIFVSTGNFSRDKSSNGIQLGVGLETMVTNNVSLKVEYDWDRFSNSSFGGHPTVNKALVGVTYHFFSA